MEITRIIELITNHFHPGYWQLRRERRSGGPGRGKDKYTNSFFSITIHDNGSITAYAKTEPYTGGYKRVALTDTKTLTEEDLLWLLATHGQGKAQLPSEQLILAARCGLN